MEEKIEKVEEAPKAEEVKVEAPKAEEPKSEKPKKIRGRIRRAPIIVWSIIGSVVLVTASAVVGSVLFAATREATYAEQGHVFALKDKDLIRARYTPAGKSSKETDLKNAEQALKNIRDNIGHTYKDWEHEEAVELLRLIDEGKSLQNILLGSTVKIGTTKLFSSTVPVEIIDNTGKALFTVNFANVGNRRGEVDNSTLKYVAGDDSSVNPYKDFRLNAAYDRANDGQSLTFYVSLSSSVFHDTIKEYDADGSYSLYFSGDYLPVTEAK